MAGTHFAIKLIRRMTAKVIKYIRRRGHVMIPEPRGCESKFLPYIYTWAYDKKRLSSSRSDDFANLILYVIT